MTSSIVALVLALAGMMFVALKMAKRFNPVLPAVSWGLRALLTAAPRLGNTKFAFIAAFLISLTSFHSAHAQSSGCSAINSAWGSGHSVSDGDSLWQDGLSVLAGEKVTYTVTSSGTLNVMSAGFAIYKNDGTNMADGISFERYAAPGAELNLTGTVTMPADDNRFVVYAWSDLAGGTVHATVTCAGKSDQTITFNNPGPLNFGTTPTLTASASSGLSPVFTSATTGVCTITNAGALTFATTGICTINTNHAGNASYNAAPQVQQSFTINPAVPVAAAVSATVNANSSVNPIPLNLSGGTATSVAVAGAPSHGTATASGMTISYTPTSGYAGSDSFTYTATNTGGTSSSATVTITVSPPTVVVLPNGALSAGTVNAAYSQTLTASGGTPPYTFSAAGSLPTGLTLSPTGILSGTPTTAGSFNFQVTATDSSTGLNAPFAGSHSYTVTIAGIAPVAGAVSATVSANSSANPITLNLSGGTAESVAVVTAASHGTASASGLSITYTPTIGYSGSDSFTYTATNTNGTSSVATVTVGVSPPTLALSPAAGALPDGTAGTAYRQTMTASLGTAPYTYGLAVLSGALPTGLSFDTTTSALSGIPTTMGTVSFTVSATDAHGATGSATYSLTTISGLQVPSTSNVSTTVDANSASNTITLALSGGTADSVAVATAPAHGTASASGITITYTPTSGYSGPDSFTYTATNTAGTSSTATVTITVSALPSLSINDVSQSEADFGTTNFTFTISLDKPAGAGGVTFDVATADATASAPDDYTSNSLTGQTISAGMTSATFTVVVKGDTAFEANETFVVNVTNVSGATVLGSQGVGTIVNDDKAVPTFALSASDSTPALGASVTFTATLAGGTSPTGTVTFKDGSTTLGTGTISGTAATFSTAVLAVGAHSVTAEYAGDTNNAAATSAAVTVNVAASAITFSPAGGALTEGMVGEAYSQIISATGGMGALTFSLKSGAMPAGVILNISTGALTGPLDAAVEAKDYNFTIEARDGFGAAGSASYTLTVKPRAVTVTDKIIDVPAGGTPTNVNLEAGATGGPFTNAEPTLVEPSNAGTASIVRGEFAAAGSTPLGWYLKFVPNPAFSGTVQVGFKLTSALGASNIGHVIYKLGYDSEKVAENINDLVHGFVQTRQGLIASSIRVPGLLERRQLENAVDPVTARMTPSEDGMRASFSTSLIQMEAARNSVDGVADSYASPFNVWIDGTLMVHKRDENDGKWGSFAMINLGADYLISEKALVGLSVHFDRMTDPTKEDAELTGNGWLAGPYASFEIEKGVFWDTSLLYGGSANDIDTTFWDGSFDTKRWMFDTAIKGEWQIDEVTALTPKLRAVYLNETVEDYKVSNGADDDLAMEGFDAEQFRVSLGAEVARSFTLENGSVVTPKFGVTAGYAGLDGSGVFGALTAGLTMETANIWMLDASLLLDIEGNGQKSVGGRVRAGKQF